MTTNLTRVYFFPLDQENEEQEPIAITLLPNGEADLSALPEKTRRGFEVFGVRETLTHETILPQDGHRFLSALLASANAYLRIRETFDRLPSAAI